MMILHVQTYYVHYKVITYLVTNISEKLMILLEFHFENAKKICTCISKPDLDLN